VIRLELDDDLIWQRVVSQGLPEGERRKGRVDIGLDACEVIAKEYLELGGKQRGRVTRLLG
jgi:hypothetical protein